jgi:hypothetical protein
MRIVLAVGWLLVPVFAWAWHTGPGQQYKKLDESNAYALLGQKALADKDFAAAVTSFDDALKCLPEGRVAVARRLRLERDKAMMQAKKLPEANSDLIDLVAELEGDKDGDAKLLSDAKAALANSQYYVTWLMRLRGYGQDVWEPEIEASRQTYRWLAEQAQAAGDLDHAKSWQEDCESAIRLARMDLEELQGLPLPSQ